MARVDETSTTAVKVVALDNLVPSELARQVDLVKIDTESTEPQVLRGALGLLRRCKPQIFCEILSEAGTAQPIQDILTPLGYRFYQLRNDGPLEQPTIEPHPDWSNYLFSTLSPSGLERLLGRHHRNSAAGKRGLHG
jgi:hypothetical protein